MTPAQISLRFDARHFMRDTVVMANLTPVGEDLLEAARSLQGETIELRRSIHAEPEIGLQLPVTQKKIVESLTGLGLNITLGESTTSVVADLDTGKPGPTVLLRGDMDALPMQEDFVSDFQSTREGAMHACGHDAHVAMLASAARLLSENKSEFTGKIRFMFQPGEEGYHGAKYMIEEGVLDGVDRAFAIHVVTNMPNGLIATKAGPLLASADHFEITVHGRGGHASAPQHCIDPIPPAAAMVGGLHNIISRDIDPTQSAVLTIAHIEAGTTTNIIPPSAFLEGTIRAFDEGVRSKIKEAVERVARGTSQAHGCTCSCEVIPGYPVTINNDEQALLTARVATALVGADGFHMTEDPALAAEDFSYVLNQVPGAMAMLGVCPDDVSPADAEPNHSNFMRVNESALYNGVGLYAAMAMCG
jgi:hippurate hydrolase